MIKFNDRYLCMSFFKQKNKVDFITLPTPDNTILYFQTIKNLSEQ
jgi:hypothetical protein